MNISAAPMVGGEKKVENDVESKDFSSRFSLEKSGDGKAVYVSKSALEQKNLVGILLKTGRDSTVDDKFFEPCAVELSNLPVSDFANAVNLADKIEDLLKKENVEIKDLLALCDDNFICKLPALKNNSNEKGVWGFLFSVKKLFGGENSAQKQARKIEEAHNLEVLTQSLGNVEQIFTKCCIRVENEKEKVISAADIKGFGLCGEQEKKLLDLVFLYYFDLVQRSKNDFVGKSYIKIDFINEEIAEKNNIFSRSYYKDVLREVENIVSGCQKNWAGETLYEYYLKRHSIVVSSKFKELDAYMQRYDSSDPWADIQALKIQIKNIKFNLDKMQYGHVVTSTHKGKIRSEMKQYQASAKQNPAMKNLLQFMLLAIYLKTLKIRDSVTSDDLIGLYRDFQV
ncbi:hypothetical protein QS306_13765 [Paraburkholderia bonniea]|uniref:hypothetical protein n=1 Tax=Paraburkholderia bonniea TaxID=2152891 RepID=UPI0012915EF1|nr:hypothetical protein [Paraburkholderia bonniea]WJF91841.1 hypothetical protein QS306_13765 [Paraburkholderia bonniea]WJF95160.1 hypothetical protein QS308_13775 [Paraburkholderia bonniea]